MRMVLRWLRRVVFAFLVVSIGAVVAYRFIDPPVTPLMLIRSAESLAAGRSPAFHAYWVDLGAISPALLRTVIAAEDARFFTHHGVDVDAVEEARTYNARHRGKRRHGASTITMQCARNVFLWQGRNWVRKALEAYFSVLIEALWGKRRILEVYLNVVEWGPGIYGAEAAARHYFRLPASQLDVHSAALLTAALPNPWRWNPAAPTVYLATRAATIAERAAAVRLAPLGYARGAGLSATAARR